MALIGKIRNNFWFVLILLGFALAAFVLMDMVNAGNQGGMGPKQLVGEVAGQEIDYQEFQKVQQTLYSGGTDSYAGRNSAWEYLKEKAIINDQASNLGIGVTDDEMKELTFGNNLSPVIQQRYMNPQTGQIDRQSLLSVQQAIEGGEDLRQDFKIRWEQLQGQVKKTAMQDKINAMVSKAIYTPTFFAENTGKRTSQTVDFEYVKIPFDNADDSDVEVTDADINSYISNNAFKYKNEEETRSVEYVTFNVVATSKDSANIKADLAERAIEFKNKAVGAEDSLFTINNEGFYNPFYAATSTLPEGLQSGVANLEVGDVYGPYLENGAYFIAKLTGKQVVPDSVEASHILRSATTDAEFSSARSYIDSLRNEIERRSISFADAATAHSQDPGSAQKNGELGTFSQGVMVPEFNNAAFLGSKEGGLYTVKTQFGIHLIQVNERVFKDRDPKYRVAQIRSVIVPSEETQQNVYDVVDDVITKNRDLGSMATAVEGMANVDVKTSRPLKINDYIVGDLGSGETSREIVKWAFEDTDPNEVSGSIYTYTDAINYYDNKYVLAGLKSIIPAGLPNASDMRDELEIAVRNQKKGELLASKISGSDLNALASANGATVETASNVAFTAGGITGLGNEPKVLSKAFGQSDGSVSSPIIGNTGVYVVKTVTKNEGSVPANVFAQKSSLNATNRSRVGFSLLNALKEKFKATDNRSKYF